MRVPINPQTNVPEGQLGYERPIDVTAGTRALGEVVNQYAAYAEEQNKKRELSAVQQKVVDETNALQIDFDAKKTAQPLGAPNFVQQVNGEYNTRHQQMVQDLKDQGYSSDAVQEYAARLGTIRSQYVGQAIDFESKSNFAKVYSDSKQMVLSLSQYVGNNPNAINSALDEHKVWLTNSGLDQVEQLKLYEEGASDIRKSAQDGFVLQHPDAIVQLYDPQHFVLHTANSPDGTSTTIATQPVKPNGQLADNIVAGLKNRGLSDAQARGVAAGITSESANNVTARNKTSGA